MRFYWVFNDPWFWTPGFSWRSIWWGFNGLQISLPMNILWMWEFSLTMEINYLRVFMIFLCCFYNSSRLTIFGSPPFSGGRWRHTHAMKIPLGSHEFWNSNPTEKKENFLFALVPYTYKNGALCSLLYFSTNHDVKRIICTIEYWIAALED